MLKVGVKLASAITDADRYLEQARDLETAGIDSIWLSESIIRPAEHERPYPPMLEPFTLLAALAAVTTRVRLGTSVSVVAMWPPVLFVSKITTLDHLSRGRIILGVGAGWEPYQFSANGLGF
jgi:alkanesulfonate monooxygenase SsuD/methylene tetrahydromethanopterin reductase-like flavin-dependent oxidoreductase (luciferase family)